MKEKKKEKSFWRNIKIGISPFFNIVIADMAIGNKLVKA